MWIIFLHNWPKTQNILHSGRFSNKMLSRMKISPLLNSKRLLRLSKLGFARLWCILTNFTSIHIRDQSRTSWTSVMIKHRKYAAIYAQNNVVLTYVSFEIYEKVIWHLKKPFKFSTDLIKWRSLKRWGRPNEFSLEDCLCYWGQTAVLRL